MRQLVQLAGQSLNAGIDEFLGRLVLSATGIDQSRNILQHAAVAGAEERLPDVLAAAASTEQHLQQAQQDIVFAGDGQVGGPGIVRVGREYIPRLVDGLRASDDHERAMGRVDPASVANKLATGRPVQLHAGDQQQVGHAAVQLHPRRANVPVPLLQDDAGLFEPGVDHRRTDGPHAGGRHPQIGIEKRQHPRAVIERADDHTGQIVRRRHSPQARADIGHLTGRQQPIAFIAKRKFHAALLHRGPSGHTYRSSIRTRLRAKMILHLLRWAKP